MQQSTNSRLTIHPPTAVMKREQNLMAYFNTRTTVVARRGLAVKTVHLATCRRSLPDVIACVSPAPLQDHALYLRAFPVESTRYRTSSRGSKSQRGVRPASEESPRQNSSSPDPQASTNDGTTTIEKMKKFVLVQSFFAAQRAPYALTQLPHLQAYTICFFSCRALLFHT